MTKKPSPKRWKLDLLANGLDFIREGIEALYGTEGTPPERARKYALLHVFSGTLLVLKERLRRGHESLIFAQVHAARSRNARTVDFDEVQLRLQGAIGVKLSRADRDTLRAVQQERNRLEHYHADLDVEKVDTLIGNLVDFLERFLREQLEESLFKHVSPTAAKKVNELAAVVETARKAREREWNLRARKYRNLPEEKLRELCVPYDQAYVHPKHGSDIELSTCPDCGCDAVAAAEKDVGVCTDCAAVHVLAQCESCKRDFVGDRGLCNRCEPYVDHAFVGDGYVGDNFFVFDGGSGEGASERPDPGDE